MNFPVFIAIGPWRLHPHLVFDLLAYSAGAALIWWQRRSRGDTLQSSTRWSIVVAAVVGAAVGSRLLFWLENPPLLLDHWNDPAAWGLGKTVVGGLIGGLIAVELAKKRIGVTTATGDLFAVPLALGIAIGRIGCFFSGLPDQTWGNPTSLWTGVDFGDGVRRHPTQLYEIVFLLALAAALVRWRRRLAVPGDQFRVFMVAYFAWRLAVDAIKPAPFTLLGLSTIQWACVAMLAYYLPHIRRWVRR